MRNRDLIDSAIADGRIFKVEGRKGRWVAVEKAVDRVGTNWWCLPIDRSNTVLWREGWRAYPEAKLTRIKRKKGGKRGSN